MKLKELIKLVEDNSDSEPDTLWILIQMFGEQEVSLNNAQEQGLKVMKQLLGASAERRRLNDLGGDK